MTRNLFVSLLLFATAGIGLSPQGLQEREKALEGRLLAPCCYQEPLSRHQSEIAVKLRMEIARMLADGKSDAEILRKYTERYGSRVLLDATPAPDWAQWVPWGIVLLSLAGLAWWLPKLVYRTVET